METKFWCAWIAPIASVWRCRTIFNCVEVCPKKLNPTERIQALKRMAVSNK